jgi:large subunit ribosomal protein L3
MKGILGRKVGMTQLLTAKGEVVPVTIIEAGPCYVTQIKTAARDGYTAIQLGFELTQPRRLTKGQVGHIRRREMPRETPMVRVLRELRLRNVEDYQLGQKILADVFTTHERVDVQGISKGRGFQGGVKRYGFRGGPRTHGQSDRLRAPGASSSGTTPGRLYKGKRMAGHMGNVPVTVANLRVVLVDPERNLLAVQGAVPGARGGLLLVTEARKQG